MHDILELCLASTSSVALPKVTSMSFSNLPPFFEVNMLLTCWHPCRPDSKPQKPHEQIKTSGH